jgi:DNA-binding response OmpR family regulator
MANTKVWIVDDDPEFLAELGEALELSGLDAEAFRDAASMRRRLGLEAPDIVLLDLKMEHEDGFRLARELRGHPRTANVPMIAMTGHCTSTEDAVRVGACGLDLCLVKPINLAELLARIALLTGGVRGAKGGRAGGRKRRVEAHTGGRPS